MQLSYSYQKTNKVSEKPNENSGVTFRGVPFFYVEYYIDLFIIFGLKIMLGTIC